MSRDFENEFGQDEERVRGRSRRRDADAGTGYGVDSNIVPPRRSRAPRAEEAGVGPRPVGSGPRPAGSRRLAAEGTEARTVGSRRAGAEDIGTRAGGTGRTAGSYGTRPTGSSRPPRPEQRSRAVGGRVYPSPESGMEKSSQLRDTAFRRNGGGSSRGSKGIRETAAADPAVLQARRRRKWIIAAIIIEVVLLCSIWTARNLIKKYNMIQRPTDFDIAKESNENLSESKIESMKGYWTIALFGVDSRSDAVGKGNNADVIIICNINQDNGEIKLVSVFRDSYLNVDDGGTYNKINQAYFSGGPKQAIQALNRNLDLQIDDFATFNWKAVADAINILGGVDVELSKAEFHYINAFITETVEATGVASVHLKQAGLNHLDGVQAVAYARLRKMDTDFARTERQRKIIDLSFQKLKQSDFSVVNNVMEVVFPQILSSVTIGDVIPAARNLTKYTIADTAGFPWARSDANMGRKGDCVIPQTLESNVILLHQFLFGEEDYQPSDMVKQISARISADSGMYNEGRPIDKVGTDGGYIPKATEAPRTTEAAREDEGETDDLESSTSETDESIIDGEYEWELETDEDGYPIDPPEDWDYGYPGGRPNTSTGAYPGASTSPNDASQSSGVSPGGSQPSSGAVTPGGTTSPAESPRYPGASTSASDEVTGPGAANTSPTTSAAFPGRTTQTTEADGPGSVIIGPGQ